MDHDDDDSLVGTLFAGRFRIEALLGSGGMGAVYLARHEVLQRRFAIKVIKRSLLTDPNVAARFRREARAASRIRHPHIVDVTDFGHTAEGRPYIVMEYEEGPTLADVLAREGPLPLPRALGILAQIADALAAAHGDQVIHRDLKPRNILLTTREGVPDQVKILDFGLAKIIALGGTEGLTRDGDTFGTPQYMSPELCGARTADHRTDIYSFGVLAFELLVGRVPFGGPILMEIIGAHLHREPPAPSAASGRVEISPGIDAMVLRCLAKSPDDRYQSAAELLLALRRLQHVFGDVSPIKPQRSGLLVVERRRTEDLAALCATLLPALPDEEEEPGEPGEPDTWPDSSESRWPQTAPGAVERRSRALEELAYAVRDRGVGSPAISQVLSLKLEADDRVLDLECDIAVIEAQVTELEARSRERGSRLGRALSQLEHERTMLQRPSPEARDLQGGGTLRWRPGLGPVEREALDAELEARSAEVTGRVREISRQAEQGVATLRSSLAQMRELLEQAQADVRRHEDQLATLLREARAEIVELDAPEITELVSLAEV